MGMLDCSTNIDKFVTASVADRQVNAKVILQRSVDFGKEVYFKPVL